MSPPPELTRADAGDPEEAGSPVSTPGATTPHMSTHADGRPAAQPARPRVPSTVKLAAMLLFAVAGVLVVRVVLTYALFDSLIDNYAESRHMQEMPRSFVEDGAPPYRPVALFNAIVFGGILTLCGCFVLRGARWARITGTVFSDLAILGGVIALLQPATVLFKLLGVLTAAALLAAVVLLWTGGYPGRREHRDTVTSDRPR